MVCRFFSAISIALALGLFSPGPGAQELAPPAERPPDDPPQGQAVPDSDTTTPAAHEPSDADAELAAYVDGLMATWRTAHGAPGYTLAVVRPERVVVARGYGLADIEAGTPVDPAATRFYIASISKTFVWTSLMMLVERGVLSLDEDVNRYLERYQVPEGERPLTLGDLMDHRGGFEENMDLFTPRIAQMDRPAALAATQPVQAFARGERAAYSNWGSNLAALVIEDATGRSYDDFLFEEILEPLGMRTTTLTERDPAARDPATPLSKNYRMTPGGPEEVPQLDLGSFAPIGGMTTTAADMARWLRFHLNRGELDGVRLLSEASYADLRERRFDPVPGAPGRAHGFFDLSLRGTTYYGHTGSINAFLSKFAVAPELGLGVFIAQNTDAVFDPLNFVPRLVFERALAERGQYDPDAAMPRPGDSAIAAAEEIAGRYVSSRRYVEGIEQIFTAFIGVVELEASDGRLVVDGGGPAFVRIAPDVWENRQGERLAVVRDEDGGVLRLITPGGATDFEPVTLGTEPRVLAAAVGATVFLSITTWLGLWRRFRQQKETRITGRLLSWVALLATVPMAWLAVVAAQTPSPDDKSFAEFFSEWPLPFLGQLSLVATVLAAVAGLMLLCTVLVWSASGWNAWRKIHFTLFALAYGALGLSLINWGLVPSIAS